MSAAFPMTEISHGAASIRIQNTWHPLEREELEALARRLTEWLAAHPKPSDNEGGMTIGRFGNRAPGAVEDEVALAAFAFYRARLKQRETKAALRTYREQHGPCSLYDNGYHPDGRDSRPSCFQTSEPRAEWCEVCQASQPLWEARRLAARDAGVALQKLMRRCSRNEG